MPTITIPRSNVIVEEVSAAFETSSVLDTRSRLL
jgi:hypothetical protein